MKYYVNRNISSAINLILFVGRAGVGASDSEYVIQYLCVYMPEWMCNWKMCVHKFK